MDTITSFNQFLALQKTQISWVEFILNLGVAALFSFLLSRVYVYFAYSLSNRRIFAKNFILVTTTTMLIITIVKSSLALSLGLVGALSIVRFRAAIKEPEELAYLFLCIAMGLGLGANQTLITSIAFFIIISILMLKKIYRDPQDEQNLFLSVENIKNSAVEIKDIVEILHKNSILLKLKRLDDRSNITSAAFQVQYKDFAQLEKSKQEIKKLHENINISFIDNKGCL